MRGKTIYLIDGANFFSAVKALGFDMDYSKLDQALGIDEGRVLRRYYFTTVKEAKSPDDYQSLKPLLDYLALNVHCKYRVVTKPVKEFESLEGERRIKSSMSVELVLTGMRHAYNGEVDQVVLFSGNGDFIPFVAELQERSIFVSVVSTMKSNPSMISDELRRQADSFLDLADLMPNLKRDLTTRRPRDDRRKFRDRDGDADATEKPIDDDR